MNFIQIECINSFLCTKNQILIWKWVTRESHKTDKNHNYDHYVRSIWLELCMCCFSPLVFGFIHEQAQWIFRGQPLNTLEKQAPICRAERSRAEFEWSKCSCYDICVNPGVLITSKSFNVCVYERDIARKCLKDGQIKRPAERVRVDDSQVL